MATGPLEPSGLALPRRMLTSTASAASRAPLACASCKQLGLLVSYFTSYCGTDRLANPVLVTVGKLSALYFYVRQVFSHAIVLNSSLVLLLQPQRNARLRLIQPLCQPRFPSLPQCQYPPRSQFRPQLMFQTLCPHRCLCPSLWMCQTLCQTLCPHQSQCL